MSPRTLSPRLAYALVAAVIGLALFASGTPSPLYAHLPRAVGLLAVVLTLIYATYAFGVLAVAPARRPRRPTSRAAGRCCSSRWARCWSRPSLFMLADSVAWLFVARGIQGARHRASRSAPPPPRCSTCTRAATPPASASPTASSAPAAWASACSSPRSLVQFAPAPRVLPYVALLVLFAIAFAGALLMPEPVARALAPAADAAAPAHPAGRPAPVPARRARRDLLVVDRRAVPVARPAALRLAVRHHQPPRAGLGIFALAGSGAAAQLLFGRSAPWAARPPARSRCRSGWC